MYRARYSDKKQEIEIIFDVKAMMGYWPSYFESGAHEANLEEMKAAIDACIRKACAGL